MLLAKNAQIFDFVAATEGPWVDVIYLQLGATAAAAAGGLILVLALASGKLKNLNAALVRNGLEWISLLYKIRSEPSHDITEVTIWHDVRHQFLGAL